MRYVSLLFVGVCIALVYQSERAEGTDAEDGCKARVYDFKTTQSRVSSKSLRITAPHRISTDVDVKIVPAGSDPSRNAVSFKVLVQRGDGDEVSPRFGDRNGLTLSFGRLDDDDNDRDDDRYCRDTKVHITLTIPDNMRFSDHSFSLNGGKAECKTDITVTALCAELTFRPWTAFGRVIEPIVQEPEYTITWLKGGIYVVREAGPGTYNALVVVTTAGVIVVDAPPTIGDNLKRAIRKITSKPVKYFVYSHRHNDHVAAARQFWKRGVTFVAQRQVKEELAKVRDSRRPVPDVAFDDEYEIRLGNETIALKYFTLSHDIGDTYVYSRQHGIVMLVDVAYANMGPFRAFAETLSVDGYQKAHDILLGSTFHWQYLVSGHFNVLTPHDVEISKNFAKDVERAAGRALQRTPLPDTGADVNGNVWLLFDSYLKLVEEDCAEAVKHAYEDLSAVDVFAESHCDIMVKHLRLESA